MNKMIFACLPLLAACCAPPQAPLTTGGGPAVPAVPAGAAAEPAPVTPVAKAAPQDTPRNFPPARTGEMSFAAEKVAKEAGCYRADSATVVAQRTGIQFYRVPCDSGRQVLVRCELRQCRLAD